MPFNVTILGSNSAIPSINRFTTSQVVNHNNRNFLIDCGEGTQIQLRRFNIKVSRINHIFISHLHGDHFFGLFGLLSSWSLTGRTGFINIYAHSGLQAMLTSEYSPVKLSDLSFKINFYDLNTKSTEVIFDSKTLEVISFPLKHRIYVNGFLFKEKAKLRNIKKEFIELYQIPVSEIIKIKEGADFITQSGKIIPNSELTIEPELPKSFAFCTDTKYFGKLPEYVKNADLLYHETSFDKSGTKLARQTGHSTTQQAAKVALNAGVKKLITGHYSNRYNESDILQFQDEIREIFPESYIVNDGDIFEI